MLTQKDLQQIDKKGIKIDDIHRQIKYFKSGFPPADIVAPATAGNGIMQLTGGEETYFREIYRHNAPDLTTVRFIPASGAATRMFRSLHQAHEQLSVLTDEEQRDWIVQNEETRHFLDTLDEYPFYEDLPLDQADTPAQILNLILGEEGLGYGQKPKGLLKFHKYSPQDRRTPLEEHIREAVRYCAGRDNKVRLHLTVSPEHLDGFREEGARVEPAIGQKDEWDIHLSFSFQDPGTDTIAVDMENNPFRRQDGSLLFRPGGHGALIQNLDAIDADFLFISNIDNVAPDRIKKLRVNYKEVLGGVLLEIRSKIFYYLNLLTAGEGVEKTRMDSMVDYLHGRLGMAIPDRLREWEGPEMKQWLIGAMNRPIRVCGMVKNVGEPGGGPFYVRSNGGEVTLQIVESSQIDLDDPEKKRIFLESTHFNPVDIACSVRDFRGKKFQLTRYVDHQTGFISEKSTGGRKLKALELPGLWNGAMAGWLTLFAEVPIETFSPVKTVFDLLRPEHQP